MIAKLTVFLLLIPVLVLLVGCDKEFGTITDSVTREIYSRPASFSRSLSFEMTSEMQAIFLRANITVMAGKMTLVAVNPDGDVVWTAILSRAKKISERHEFPSVEGTWTVYYEGEATAADIELRWIGRFWP